MEKQQDCLLQGQAQLDQKVVFRFVILRLRGGGVLFDKNENHGLEMHFKSFEVFLVYVLFLPIPPSSYVVAGLIIVSIQFFPMKF